MKAFLTLLMTIICISSCATTGVGQMCDPAINAVVTDVLNQSLGPDSEIRIPDQELASKYGFVFVLKEIDENRCNIHDAGFSELANEQFKLVNKSQLNSEASRRDGQLVYVRIGSVEIDGDVAHIRIGASVNIWPKKKVGLMCCCIGDMVLDRSVDGWVFREWGLVLCG